MQSVYVGRLCYCSIMIRRSNIKTFHDLLKSHFTRAPTFCVCETFKMSQNYCQKRSKYSALPTLKNITASDAEQIHMFSSFYEETGFLKLVVKVRSLGFISL